MSAVHLHLLRHARVASHRGDIPLAEDADGPIAAAAERIAEVVASGEAVIFLTTATRRSRETAEALRAALTALVGAAAEAAPCTENEALRNPDLYLDGTRVEMVSTAAAFAAQLPEGAIDEAGVMAHPFFRGFLTAPDRIEYWLTHPAPPGEAAADVARRVMRFGASFRILPGGCRHVICVSHSPVMRAVLVESLRLADPGEPDWVEGIALEFGSESCGFRFRGETGVAEIDVVSNGGTPKH